MNAIDEDREDAFQERERARAEAAMTPTPDDDIEMDCGPLPRTPLSTQMVDVTFVAKGTPPTPETPKDEMTAEFEAQWLAVGWLTDNKDDARGWFENGWLAAGARLAEAEKAYEVLRSGVRSIWHGVVDGDMDRVSTGYALKELFR